MIRVVIADDQDMVRYGFELILNGQDDMEVVASVADGRAAMDAADAFRPDVMLLDIRMPQMDGLQVCRRISGSTNVVIVTTFDDPEFVDEALDAGARGFILKDSGPELLIESVRAATRGHSLISPAVMAALLDRRLQPRRCGLELSTREREVARLVAAGRTNEEIAAELFISLSTVKTHLSRIQARTGARNRVEIAASMWRAGEMDDDIWRCRPKG